MFGVGELAPIIWKNQMQPTRLLTALVFWLASQAAMANPTVGFNFEHLSADPGDTFELILRGMGFDQTIDGKVINNITGGQKFNVTFNHEVLAIIGTQIDARWAFSSGNKTGTVNNATGTLTGLAFGTLPATTDDDFNIARITFKALQTGQSEIIISGGEFAAKVNNLAGAKILPSYDNVVVQVVPEPEQWAMLLAGMGLLGLRRRKH